MLSRPPGGKTGGLLKNFAGSADTEKTVQQHKEKWDSEKYTIHTAMVINSSTSLEFHLFIILYNKFCKSFHNTVVIIQLQQIDKKYNRHHDFHQ